MIFSSKKGVYSFLSSLHLAMSLMHARHRASHARPKRDASPHCLLGKSFSGSNIFLNDTTKDVHSTSHDKENPIEMIALGRGMGNLLVAFILLVLLVQVQTFLRNGEYGSKTCFFAVNRSTLVVCLGIFSKSYEVLTSPSFPYQF